MSPILLALLFIICLGCGEGAPAATATAEQVLRARATEAYEASKSNSWDELYQYTSPRFRQVCDSVGFVARVDSFVALIHGFMSISEASIVEFEVRDVQITGEEAAVFIEYLSEGELLELGDKGRRRWVLRDGVWWEEHPSWQDGCVGWKLFE